MPVCLSHSGQSEENHINICQYSWERNVILNWQQETWEKYWLNIILWQLIYTAPFWNARRTEHNINSHLCEPLMKDFFNKF
jgi:hypothetical protein